VLRKREALEGHAAIVRATTDVPGLTLVLRHDLPKAAIAAFRETLGERLILE
jgi:hypothetical protein